MAPSGAVASSLAINLLLLVFVFVQYRASFTQPECEHRPAAQSSSSFLHDAKTPEPQERMATLRPVVDSSAPTCAPHVNVSPMVVMPPTLSSPLFFSRVPVVLTSASFQLESIYGVASLSDARRTASCPQDCELQCTAKPDCIFWSLDRRERVCYLFTQARENELLKTRSMQRGVIDRWVSGTPLRPFVVFHSPWTDRPRSQRTLMVVNFNWRARLDELMSWSWMYARIPFDVDFVLVQPYRHAWTLANPWSDQGKLGYLSFSIAHASLPGYRDYQYINDDSPYFFRNVHFDVNLTAQSWTNAHWDQHGNNIFFKNASFPQGRNWWMWFTEGPMLLDDDELLGLGSNSRGDNRTENALRELGFGDYDYFYFCNAGSDAFHVAGKDMELFIRFAAVMGKHGVFLEIAVPNIFNFGKLRVNDEAPFFHARFYEARDFPDRLYSFTNDDGRSMHWLVIHPCKPSTDRCQLFMMSRTINEFAIEGQPWQ